MNREYKAVIFDLDGTLIDSMWVWEQLDRDYLARFNLVIPDGFGAELEGLGFTETAEHFKKTFELPDTIEQIKEEWTKIAHEYYTTRVTLKPNVKEFLEHLKQKEIKIGIATSNNKYLAKEVLEKLEVLEYFDTIRTSCEVEKGKPHPFVYLKAAQDLGVEPAQCLVFEDVPNGIRGGKNAGMSAWAIEDRQEDAIKQKLKELADHYIINYEEAIDFFR